MGNEIYGETEPFVNIVEAEKEHYAMIVDLMEKYEVEMPTNDWCEKIEIPNEYIECCEKAVSAEINNIAMYEHLLEYVEEEDVRDILYRLQAASYNNHLPAFRRCVNMYSMGTANIGADATAQQNPMQNPMDGLNDMMGKVDEFSAIAQKAASGNFSQEDIMKLLSSNHVSMIGGAVLGALGAGVVSQMIKDKDEDNKEEEDSLAK